MPGRQATAFWPLRVVLSLPLVWGGSVAVGLAVYLLALAGTVGDPGLSSAWQVVGAVAAFAVATLAMLACGLLLRDRPCCRLALVVLAATVAMLVVVSVAVVFGGAALPIVGGGVVLAYVTVVLGLFWLVGRRGTDAEAVGRAAPSASSTSASAGSPLGRVVRWLAAAAALAAALAVGLLSFSLAATSLVAGQPELGWDETLYSAAASGGTGARLFHITALVFTSLGATAVFGLLVWAAARALGGWRGRVSFWWAVTLGVVAILGVVFWLVDGTLPKG